MDLACIVCAARVAKVFNRSQKFKKDFSLFIKQLLLFEPQKKTESKNQKTARTKNRRIILLSKCKVCERKKLKIIKDQQTTKS